MPVVRQCELAGVPDWIGSHVRMLGYFVRPLKYLFQATSKAVSARLAGMSLTPILPTSISPTITALP